LAASTSCRDGDVHVFYRRHSADWLRMVPLDGEDDPDSLDACAQYEITVEPMT
jgi:hypothetical protein